MNDVTVVSKNTSNIYDVVGVGFGPSNLALAASLRDNNAENNLRAIFFEKKEKFCWHNNMMLVDTDMQISFLKDLAMLRSPSSQFTFLNFLHASGRLEEFINMRNFYPSRIEFNQYLLWAERQVRGMVEYSSEVINLDVCNHNGLDLFSVTVRDSLSKELSTYLARNVVVASGPSSFIPDFVEPIEPGIERKRLFHSSSYLAKIKDVDLSSTNPTVAVVGSGQSAGEIIYDLHNRLPKAKIFSFFRGFAFKPSDDSEFVNEIFTKSSEDLIFSCDQALRRSIIEAHRDTNYAVIDVDLIKKLYQKMYAELVSGEKRLIFKPLSEISKITEHANDCTIHFIDKSKATNFRIEEIDVVILATGYKWTSAAEFFPDLTRFFICDSVTGRVKVNASYAATPKAKIDLGLYIQGGNESTHGLSDTLLSLTAVRAEKICSNIIERKNNSTRPARDGLYQKGVANAQ